MQGHGHIIPITLHAADQSRGVAIIEEIHRHAQVHNAAINVKEQHYLFLFIFLNLLKNSELLSLLQEIWFFSRQQKDATITWIEYKANGIKFYHHHKILKSCWLTFGLTS